MSGRRIDDHSSWAGNTAGGKIPQESKVKEFKQADCAGELKEYQDTSEKVKMAQDKAADKVMAHKPKEGYRN